MALRMASQENPLCVMKRWSSEAMTDRGMLRAISFQSTTVRWNSGWSLDCCTISQVTGGSMTPSRPAQRAVTTRNQKQPAPTQRKETERARRMCWGALFGPRK